MIVIKSIFTLILSLGIFLIAYTILLLREVIREIFYIIALPFRTFFNLIKCNKILSEIPSISEHVPYSSSMVEELKEMEFFALINRALELLPVPSSFEPPGKNVIELDERGVIINNEKKIYKPRPKRRKKIKNIISLEN